MNKNNNIIQLLLFFVGLLLLLLTDVAADALSKNNDEAESNQEHQYQKIESSPILTSIIEEEPLPPLFPFRWQDSLGYGVAILALLLAAGGGIGGGGILVPTYILLLEFPVKHAIPLASTTVFGGAIANNLLNAGKKHPNHSTRSVIDWELMLQLEPMNILGALFGTVLNAFLPGIILIVMMLLLLTVTAYETLNKAYKLHQKENEEIHKMTKGCGETKPLIEDYSSKIALDITETEEHDEMDSSRTAIYSATKLSSFFALITILNLFSGGPHHSGSGPFGLGGCGPYCFWMVLVATIMVSLIFAFYQRHELLLRIEKDHFVYSDIVWTKRNTIYYPCYSILAGLVAGLFGIGGGIINAPLMLALGVHPVVVSATAACMVLFTSSTATVSYLAYGLLVPDHAVFCFLVGLISTFVGQTVMSVLLKRFKRHSYIAFCIGIVVAVSAVAMAIESVVAIRAK